MEEDINEIEKDEIKKFLDDYSLIDPEKDLNFFQITDFPNLENVSSNVLKFLFKFPLILKVFLNCVQQWKNTGVSDINYDTSEDKIIERIREKSTEENNRIDIVVETNKYIIGIENKIEAPSPNPFYDYKSCLDKSAEVKGKKALLIVLLKNKQSVKKVNVIEEVNGYVLYKDFSAKLKENYSELCNNLGDRYFFILKEYVSNIDNNFSKGEDSMNLDEFIEIAKHDGNIAKIEQIMLYGEQLRKKLIEREEKIRADLQKFKPRKYYEPSYKELWIIAKFEGDILSAEKYNFVIDVLVKVSGYTISIFDKDKKIDDQKEILNEILEFAYDDKGDWGDGRRAYIKIEEYDELIEILKQILKFFANRRE